MQLSKKDTGPKKYADTPREYPKGEPFNSVTMRLVYSSVMPHGKYKGKTLEYVMEHDEWYYNWLFKEHLITSWGLCKSIQKQVTGKVTDYLYCENGEVWVGIIEYEVKGVCSPYL